jgi:hypothetical protein
MSRLNVAVAAAVIVVYGYAACGPLRLMSSTVSDGSVYLATADWILAGRPAGFHSANTALPLGYPSLIAALKWCDVVNWLYAVHLLALALGLGAFASVARKQLGMADTPIASYCLQAMGETLYDVSALPNSSRPEIHWSYDNPAEALESLCESLGCRVVLDLPSNGVRVVTIGEGNDLPTEPVQWVSEGVNPPEVPSALIFVGGQTVQQGFIPLTAVGRDVSGEISPITNLSYAPPATGWTNEMIDFPSITSEPAHTYAEESVYRWWQPTLPYTAPDGTVVTNANQLILYDRQIDTNLNPTGPSGATTQKPEILGYFDPCYAQVDASLGTVLTYHGSIQIDQNRCLVITGDPLVDSEYGRNLPARIWLKTSFSIRAPANREPYRYTQLFPLPGSPNLTQPRVVRHDEVVLQVRGVYDTSNGITQTGQTDNSSWVGAAANYYLQATADQYETTDSLDVPYVGIVPIQVDGAIQQVTYSIQSGEGGKTLTRASRNTEHSHYIPKYEKRRAQAANKAVTDKVISQQSPLAETQQNTGQPFVS